MSIPFGSDSEVSLKKTGCGAAQLLEILNPGAGLKWLLRAAEESGSVAASGPPQDLQPRVGLRLLPAHQVLVKLGFDLLIFIFETEIIFSPFSENDLKVQIAEKLGFVFLDAYGLIKGVLCIF